MESGAIDILQNNSLIAPSLLSTLAIPTYNIRTENILTFNGGGDLDGIPTNLTDDSFIYAGKGFTFNNTPVLPVQRDAAGNPIRNSQNRQILLQDAVVVGQGFTTTNAPNNQYANLVPPTVVPLQTITVPSYNDTRIQELNAKTPTGAIAVTFNASQNPLNNANEWNQRFPSPGTATNPKLVRVTGGGLNIPNNVNLANYIIKVENGDINFNGNRQELTNVILNTINGNINLQSIQGDNLSVLSSGTINMNNQARFAGKSLLANGNGGMNFDGATSTTTNTDFVKIISQGNVNVNANAATRGSFLTTGAITFNGNTNIFGSVEAKGNITFNGQATVTGIAASVPVDTTPPAITAQLQQDSGSSATDKITNAPPLLAPLPTQARSPN
jgi:hypothetical protein